MQRFFLGMENTCGAFEVETLFTAYLGDGAVGCDIAVKNRQVAVRLDRIVEVSNDILTVGIIGDLSQVLGQGLPGHGHAVAVQQAAVEHAFHQRLNTADLDELRHQVAPARFYVGQHRHTLADRREIVQ